MLTCVGAVQCIQTPRFVTLEVLVNEYFVFTENIQFQNMNIAIEASLYTLLFCLWGHWESRSDTPHTNSQKWVSGILSLCQVRG